MNLAIHPKVPKVAQKQVYGRKSNQKGKQRSVKSNSWGEGYCTHHSQGPQQTDVHRSVEPHWGWSQSRSVGSGWAFHWCNSSDWWAFLTLKWWTHWVTPETLRPVWPCPLWFEGALSKASWEMHLRVFPRAWRCWDTSKFPICWRSPLSLLTYHRGWPAIQPLRWIIAVGIF